ncbi:DUF1194 domain-containing protein [Anianabacter salinae]|uniref:DUF1194 domain-containing protein n=1 Tax=Anianabacter salinae TaxID=2851023 RepID=UPI00225E2910|nr:DUF1194 domain-containing protein [Anianabacter salinae]
MVRLLAPLLLWPGAADAACRLALLLALDISSSVDPGEDALQRQGLAAALIAPEVQAAMFSAPGDTVALAVYEWSGRYQQDVILDWVLVQSPADLERAAVAVASSRRSYAEFPTALGYSVGFAASLFAAAPDCLFRTLDVSGDGVNNDGFAPRLAYRNFPLDEVTVNGLAIGSADGVDLAEYYRRELIRGPGAFVEVADGFDDFERAMRRKLVRELQAMAIGALPGAEGPG